MSLHQGHVLDKHHALTLDLVFDELLHWRGPALDALILSIVRHRHISGMRLWLLWSWSSHLANVLSIEIIDSNDLNVNEISTTILFVLGLLILIDHRVRA